MRYTFLILSLLAILTCTAQDIDPAPSFDMPELRSNLFRAAYGANWQISGYAIEYSNPFIGLTSATTPGEQLLLLRYPETDVATARIPLAGKGKRRYAEGAASFLSPNSMVYQGGAFRQNKPSGPWTAVYLGTVLNKTCPDFTFETTSDQVVEVLRTCYPDTAIQKRVRVHEATYEQGILNGPAQRYLLDGTFQQSVTYRSGRAVGEEIQYSYQGKEEYRVQHDGRSSDTTYTTLPEPTDTITTFKVVERMPAFSSPDCKVPLQGTKDSLQKAAYQSCTTQAMLEYIYNSIHYPSSSRMAGIDGITVVTFVVEKDGSLSGIRTVRFISGPIDAEAVRVVSSMPAWAPGYQRGEAVRVQFNLPIRFLLE